jgi:SAM-dependent methyltransferase
VSADIFADQPSDAALLAELYDVEHDEIVEDFVFYRELAHRAGGSVLDLGCGSGRLFAPLIAGGAARLVGIDGSAAMLQRAAERIAGNPALARAAAAGRIELLPGDARRLDAIRALGGRSFDLAVAVGVVPHLDGPEDAVRMLQGVRRLLARDGRLVLDDLGPAQMPDRDLPLTVDWRRSVEGQQVVRRSQLMRREAPEGLRVAYSTITDVGQPDGTIARLPASHLLWYPSSQALATLVREAGLVLEQAYGSHDLEPLSEQSDRQITVTGRTGGQT